MANHSVPDFVISFTFNRAISFWCGYWLQHV